MRIGVLLINFGEPAEPTLESVMPFLERIFLQNADLERDESALARAKKLAADRAPGLLADYLTIGGSPLNAQAEAQSDALQEAPRGPGCRRAHVRGFPVHAAIRPGRCRASTR